MTACYYTICRPNDESVGRDLIFNICDSKENAEFALKEQTEFWHEEGLIMRITTAEDWTHISEDQGVMVVG